MPALRGYEGDMFNSHCKVSNITTTCRKEPSLLHKLSEILPCCSLPPLHRFPESPLLLDESLYDSSNSSHWMLSTGVMFFKVLNPTSPLVDSNVLEEKLVFYSIYSGLLENPYTILADSHERKLWDKGYLLQVCGEKKTM